MKDTEENSDITALMNINARLQVFFKKEKPLDVNRSLLGGLRVTLHVNL